MCRKEDADSPLKHNVAVVFAITESRLIQWIAEMGSPALGVEESVLGSSASFARELPPNTSLDAFLEPALQWFSSCPLEFSEMDHDNSSLTTGSLYY